MATPTTSTPSLFPDSQKTELVNQAKETGLDTSTVTPDSFDRTVDPASGEATMFLKLPSGNFKGNGQSFTQQATTPASNMTQYMANLAKLSADMVVSTPNKQQITDAVGIQSGLYNTLDVIAQKKLNLLRTYGGDHSDIFNMTNSDGSPISAEAKMALYDNRMSMISQNIGLLSQTEQMHTEQLNSLAEYQYGIAQQKQAQIQQTMEMTKTLMDYDQKQQTNALTRMGQEQDARNNEADQQYKQQSLQQNQNQFDASMDEKKSEFTANLTTNTDKALEAPAP